MSNVLYTITPDQFMLLQGFMLYRWNANHGDEKTNSKFDENSFWADQLDDADICWYVQNMAAHVMEKRENGWKYFRNLLKDEDIEIEVPKPKDTNRITSIGFLNRADGDINLTPCIDGNALPTMVRVSKEEYENTNGEKCKMIDLALEKLKL